MSLLEKMPAMQVSRMSSQNGESSGSYEDHSPDLIENGLGDEQIGTESNMNTMSDNTVSILCTYEYLKDFHK